MPLNLSLAEKAGIVTLVSASVLLVLGTWLYVLPLIGFVLCCTLAPFVPNFSFFLHITSRGKTSSKSVTLSFDDGPDKYTTPAVLKILDDNNIKATFFVVGYKAEKNQEIIRMILDRGHSIGNHSYSHDHLLMLKSSRKLTREIHKTQEVLRQQGVAPLAFRPPIGITNPRLKKILSEAGMFLVNFTHRSGDRGNRFINGFAEKILSRIKAGEIIVLHDKRRENTRDFDEWLIELNRVIRGIELKGLNIVPLDELIDRSVMLETDKR